MFVVMGPWAPYGCLRIFSPALHPNACIMPGGGKATLQKKCVISVSYALIFVCVEMYTTCLA